MIIHFSDLSVFPIFVILTSSRTLIFLAWLKSAYFFDFIYIFGIIRLKNTRFQP